MTKKDILKIKEPFDLFGINKNKLKSEYRSLSLKYHPDHNKTHNANEEYSHVCMLYNEAQDLLSKPQWISKTRAMFIDSKTLQKYLIKFHKCYNFELGKFMTSDSIVLYSIDKEYKKFYDNAILNLKNRIKYNNKKMEDEISKYIPIIKKTFIDLDGNYNILFEKTPDMLPLSDVLSYYGDDFDPRAAAWILSRLYNLACYFHYLKLVHCGISLSNCFISTEFHFVVIFGGWWYSVPQNCTMIGMESNNYALLKDGTRIANRIINLEQIKAIGRELLGDRTGAKLIRKRDKELKPLIDWLLYPAGDKAIVDFKYYYKKVLPETFGPPKFIKMDLTSKILYKEN